MEKMLKDDSKFYDVFDYHGEGYKPLLDFEAWRIAGLRYAERFGKDHFYRVERHCQTDEVFLLLQGDAYLIIGDDQLAPQFLNALKMEKGKVYNIRKNVWHHILTTKDAYIFIVENSNTSLDNSGYYEVTQEQRQAIMVQVDI